jgi:hypothetical protein
MFNGTNMDISDFIKRLEYAAQIDGALGSDIALQIIFFLKGETLVKEVQEMAEKENHDWEKLKERMVLRWGKMMPLLKHTRNDLDQLLATTRASGIKTQREFQNFRIKIDNLVAYLVRCQHMGNAEEIRHAVLNCLVHPIKVSVTKELNVIIALGINTRCIDVAYLPRTNSTRKFTVKERTSNFLMEP